MSATFGLVGALAAFPLRLAQRAAEENGDRVLRGTRRATTHAVFGHGLLERSDDAELAVRLSLERTAGRQLLSEHGFLRQLGLRGAASAADFSRQVMIDRSGLEPAQFDLLSILDAFERDVEPFSFSDLLRARKYAGLVADGASCRSIARAVHSAGESFPLTRKTLQVAGQTILAREGVALSEFDGQLLMPLPESADCADGLFAEAQDLETAGRTQEAAVLYARCIALDRSDVVAAFNRANCLRSAGQIAEAEQAYLAVIKADGSFVEAWFNLAGLLSETGRPSSARRYLEQAIAIDPDYADAVYNLAAMAFEAGDHETASRWWTRYLELDPASDWGQRARRGLQAVAGRTVSSSDA